MRRVFNFGSINIDHVYRMPRLARPGETLSSSGYTRGPGGKGFNQSVALARAGAAVSHIGFIGGDGAWLRDLLSAEGVDCAGIRVCGEATGHAIIQVLPDGENTIFLHPGANRSAGREPVRTALTDAQPGDWFLCQNETSAVPEALGEAKRLGLKTVLNAAPAPDPPQAGLLKNVDLLIVNESEASALGGLADPMKAAVKLRSNFPELDIVLTLGAAGAVWSGPGISASAPGIAAKAVDTTAAGDTFTGYLLSALLRGKDPREAMALANRAASAAVSRHGAADSIPRLREVEA
jgi:ribokinase